MAAHKHYGRKDYWCCRQRCAIRTVSTELGPSKRDEFNQWTDFVITKSRNPVSLGACHCIRAHCIREKHISYNEDDMFHTVTLTVSQETEWGFSGSIQAVSWLRRKRAIDPGPARTEFIVGKYSLNISDLPLSVPFHYCSILIFHSPTNDDTWS